MNPFFECMIVDGTNEFSYVFKNVEGEKENEAKTRGQMFAKRSLF